MESGKKTAEFEGHNGDVVSISLSPDNNQYVTGSVDKTCKLWDARDTKPKQQFFGHEADVNSVCVRYYILKAPKVLRNCALRAKVRALGCKTHPRSQNQQSGKEGGQ